jgi:hypothetical protein
MKRKSNRANRGLNSFLAKYWPSSLVQDGDVCLWNGIELWNLRPFS